MQPSYNISALKASVYSIKTLQLADLIDVHKRLAENEKL